MAPFTSRRGQTTGVGTGASLPMYSVAMPRSTRRAPGGTPCGSVELGEPAGPAGDDKVERPLSRRRRHKVPWLRLHLLALLRLLPPDIACTGADREMNRRG